MGGASAPGRRCIRALEIDQTLAGLSEWRSSRTVPLCNGRSNCQVHPAGALPTLTDAESTYVRYKSATSYQRSFPDGKATLSNRRGRCVLSPAQPSGPTRRLVIRLIIIPPCATHYLWKGQ